MGLVLFSALGSFGIYASFAEVAFITVGTGIFVVGQMRSRGAEPAVRRQGSGGLLVHPR
jgi:hypothetical protein